MTVLLREKKVMKTSVGTGRNLRPLTVKEAFRELSEVRSIPIQMEKYTTWVRTDIRGNAAKLMKALGVSIPSKILKIDGA